MNTLISPLARHAIEIGRDVKYRFRVVEENQSGWVTETVPLAPVIAQERLKLLTAHGYTFQRILIAHEAPKLLNAPKVEPKPRPQENDFKTAKIVPDFSGLSEILFLVVGLFFQAILIDPAVIVVLEDGTHLEVVRWLE